MAKVNVHPWIHDSQQTFDLRTKFLNSLQITPIVALEIARIIQAMIELIKYNKDASELYFTVVHGDKVRWQDIKSAMQIEFPNYNIKISKINNIDHQNKEVFLVVAAGPEEELSQLGDVTHTFAKFNLKNETVQ